MILKRKKPIWILVTVQSGIPAEVEAFTNKKQAFVRGKVVRRDLNFDNDETGLFEVVLNHR